MPCSDMFIYLSLTLGAKLGNKIGVRPTITIALIFKYISYLMLIFLPNYYLVLVAMCFLGFGSGLSNLTYIKNSWKYFPKSQGLVNGLILGGGGLSSSILTPLADFFIINPNKESADPDTGLYDKNIADRVPSYLKILFIIFVVLGILSIIFSFPYIEENNDEHSGKEREITGTKKESKELFYNEDARKASLLQIFFSIKNYVLIRFCFCGFCKYKLQFIVL